MKSRAITLIILILLGIPMLILLGQWSATEPVLAGLSIFAVVAVVGLLQLGQKCWLLIPFFSSFTGALVILPGEFAPRDLVVGVVVAQLVLIWLVRRFPLNFRFGLIEVIFLIVLAFIGQAFLRNPAGLSVLGSESVGARPYFEIGVSAVAFMVLSTQVVGLRDVRLLVIASLCGALANGVYEALTGAIPSLAYLTSRVYKGKFTTTAIKSFLSVGESAYVGTGRLPFLSLFATPIMQIVYAYCPPLKAFNPLRVKIFLLVMLAAVCALLSGFRGVVVSMGVMTVAAALLHRKGIQLVIMTMIGGPLLAVVLILQGSVINLPLPAQRALSFLPADWDYTAVAEAKDSSEWRFEMWQLALESDRYIRNKWLGDGYGFTAAELAYQQDAKMTRVVGQDEQQDYFLMTGTYHSGPIETIKRVGYIGLVILLVALILMASLAVKLVNRCRHTPYFGYAMFIALPMVTGPFMFVFVFGTFQGALTLMLSTGAMMRMVQTSLERHAAEPEVSTAQEMLPPASQRSLSRA